ncbi:MAG: DUF4405 domain-containing protein [bacterium]|nr:DUF4405 domain-containing protein [bacterium]
MTHKAHKHKTSHREFHYRSFVSFFIFFNFIVMTLTGLILYITPPGRIARWTAWVFLGMSKDQLEGIHTVSSILFFAAALFHIFLYNRRIFWSYIKKQTSELKKLRRRCVREFTLALVLSVLIFIGSLIPFSPFSDIIDIGDDLKKSWGDSSMEAPVSGAEKLSLKEVSERLIKRDVSEVITQLRADSLKVENESQTLKEISRNNNLSPAELYEIIKNPR